MIGTYTRDEMRAKANKHHVTTGNWDRGRFTITIGQTKNYYRREHDGSWSNYDCRTIEKHGVQYPL